MEYRCQRDGRIVGTKVRLQNVNKHDIDIIY